MKPLYRGLAVAIAAVGIAACVKQAWRVTYEGPDGHSDGHVLAVASDGTAYLGGFISPGQLFVVAYAADGTLLWARQLDAGSAGNNLFPGKMIALDADGDIYFASMRFPELASSLYKLDGRTGDLLQSVELPEGEAFNHMQIGADGLLYMGGWAGVSAYAASGELVWAHRTVSSMADEIGNGETLPIRDLDNYLDHATVSAVAASSTNATGLYRLERIAFVGGRTFVMFGDRIVELDAAGQMLNELISDEVGVNSFESLTATDDGLMVVAQEDGAVVSIRLGVDLVQQSRNSLATGQWRSIKAFGGDGHVCLGLYEPATNTIEMQQLSRSGEQNWTANVAQEGFVQWEYAHVLAAGADCYLGLPVELSSTELNTITRRYDSNGKLTDTIDLKQFVPTGLAVVGKSIYHGGSTETDDQTRLIAAVIKHQRY